MVKHPAEVFGYPTASQSVMRRQKIAEEQGGIRLKVALGSAFHLLPILYSVKMGKLHTKCCSTLGCGS